MKRILLKFAFFMLVFATVFIACRESIFEMTDDSMNVEEAQAWYKAHLPDLLVLKSGNTQRQAKVVKPDWNSAVKSKNDKVEVVETYLMSNGGFGFATEESHCAWENSRNAKYMVSLPRLVIMKNKKTGETVSFIMTIVGDKAYLEKHQFKLWQNSYLKKDNDFNGLVLFHNLEGTFVNGWRFTDGKVSHTVAMNFETGLPLRLKSGYYNCTTYNVYGWYEQCTDYYTIGEVDGRVVSVTYTGETCGTYSVYEGSYTQCTEVPDPNGGGGSGGGISSFSHNASPQTPLPPLKMECMGGSGVISSTLTIYVDQPISGSSSAYTTNGTNIEVGHTFVKVESVKATGETEKRVFGFYPTASVSPFSPSTNGVITVDDGHNFDVSMTINISNSTLSEIISYTNEKRNSTYNLNNFNCTDFALNLASIAGIHIIDAYGTWPGGGGSNPGALGEEIRSMSNSSSRTINRNGGVSDSSGGPCNN